jgi:hypothetical protein
MTKIRQVFDRDMVAHLWANRSQDSAPVAGGNFWFTGAALFSYRESFMVAGHLDDGRVIWNDESYSKTTSRHQWAARNALRGQQWETAVHVPGLGYQGFRALERMRAQGDGRVMPDLAKDCAGRVVSIVQSMAKMRETAGKIRGAYAEALKYQRSGLALCGYVAKGRRVPRWPLPMLPEEMPRGDALRALIRDVARGKLLERHASLCDASARLIDTIRARVESSDDWAHWDIRNTRGNLALVMTNLSGAAHGYTAATGRKSARVAKMRKDFAKLEPAALAIVERWEAESARASVRMLAREAFSFLRAWTGTEGRQGRRSAGYLANKMREEMRALPEGDRASWAPLLARLARVDAWGITCESLDTARGAMSTAQSYEPGHPRDALREYSRALSALSAPLRFIESARMVQAWARVHGVEAQDIRTRAMGQRDTLRAELQAREARIVDEWKAGGAERPSFDAGTFARIRGDVVETSRGAHVPIAHACRLARIARRVISAGGRSWNEGEGPMVGGFRVRSIGADGATVIGCHEFDAAEALRMLALLESCEHCARVPAETDEGA